MDMADLEAQLEETLNVGDMDMEEAMAMVQRAIRSGIDNDLGSGSNVDLCVITKDGAEMMRNVFKTQIPHKKDFRYEFKRGTTTVLRRERDEFEQDDYDKQAWHKDFGKAKEEEKKEEM